MLAVDSWDEALFFSTYYCIFHEGRRWIWFRLSLDQWKSRVTGKGEARVAISLSLTCWFT